MKIVSMTATLEVSKKNKPMEKPDFGASNFNSYDNDVLFFRNPTIEVAYICCFVFFSQKKRYWKMVKLFEFKFQHVKDPTCSNSKLSFIQIVNSAVHLNMRPYLRIAKMATWGHHRNFMKFRFASILLQAESYKQLGLTHNFIKMPPKNPSREDLHPLEIWRKNINQKAPTFLSRLNLLEKNGFVERSHWIFCNFVHHQVSLRNEPVTILTAVCGSEIPPIQRNHHRKLIKVFNSKKSSILMGFDLIAQGQQFPNFQIFLCFFSAEAHLDLCGRQKAHSEVLGHLFSPSEGGEKWAQWLGV